MKLIRARTKFGIEMIKPLVKSSGDVSADELVDYLTSLLVGFPQNIFIVLAIDDSVKIESEMLKGFVIGVSLPDQDYSTIVQLECNDFLLKDSLFHRVVLWSEGLDKVLIKLEVFSDNKSFSKRWDFRLFSKIMKYDIKSNDVTKQLLRLGEELEPLDCIKDSKNADTDKLARGTSKNTTK